VRKRLVLLPVTALALAGLPLVSSAKTTARPWAPRPATYGTVVESDLPVTMSDGVRLNVDVIRPAGKDGKPAPGRFPVLLTQTPYNKNSPRLNFRSDYLVSRGYVQVIADVRGTGGSEGEWHSFDKREQRDGYELVLWAGSRARPWSNGAVGLHGTSYGAINQIFTSAQHPKGLRSSFTIVPMGDSYRDITGSGGQVNTSFIPSWLGLVTGTGLLPPTYTAKDPVRAAKSIAGHVVGVKNFQASTVAKSTTGGETAYDGPFYRTRSPIEVVDRVRVPTFVAGGWSDLFQRGEPMLYQHLRRNGVPTRLVMGPWTHIGAGNGLPADGVRSLDELELRWHDRYLRGMSDRTLDRDVPPVTYFEPGAGHYRMTTSWPPPGVKYRQVYLSGAAVPGRAGSLAARPPKAGVADTLVWNPSAGACSRSSVQWTAGAGEGGPCDTDNRSSDAAGLTYDLPVDRTTRLAGHFAARLFVSSARPDAMLTVRVEDVAPSGASTQISAGWQVLSLRALDSRKTLRRNGLIVQPYHPFTKASERAVPVNTPVEVWVEVFASAASLAPGHSLRLALQATDTPHLTPPAQQGANSAANVLKIYHDAQHRSSLVIPTLG
jgi:putative CocE/NonD family hydrolase